jgi:peptidoglycan/LPS O-acetylase OafA/YrhL
MIFLKVKLSGEENPIVQAVWSINYWTVFVLNWFVLPILQEYLAAGDFTRRERIMRSLRNNIPLLLVYFVTFIIIMIVLAVTEKGQQALKKYEINTIVLNFM